MKILKRLLITIAILIGLLLVIGLFTKKEYHVEREIVINKPRQEVFDYVKILEHQKNYHKWVMMDPNMKTELKGTDGTVGFIMAWDSENKDAGKGEQEIKKIAEGEQIDLEIRFIKPFEGKANTSMTTGSVSANETKVKWHFTGAMNYPMNVMLLFMNMDKFLGKDLAASLSNLKSVLEKQ